MPKWAIYGATKIYDDYLSRALSYEYRNSLNICSFTPNAVDTNLVSTVGWRRRNALPQIQPSSFVKAVLRNLHVDTAVGHFWHDV